MHFPHRGLTLSRFMERKQKIIKNIAISGSHGGEYEDGSLLGSCAV
jgi:hypothetical protein